MTECYVAVVTADAVNVHNVTAVNTTVHGTVLLLWTPPQAPNGLVTTYEIEVEHVANKGVCIVHVPTCMSF